MMGVAIQVEVELYTVSCKCGGTYAINERFRAEQHKVGGSWTCPYCKTGWGYGGNSENEKLKRQLAEEQQRKERALADANELRASLAKTEASAARLKKRIKNGVCPYCHRTVGQLARHMKTKHPDFAVNGTGHSDVP